jgi:hypothetical protein
MGTGEDTWGRRRIRSTFYAKRLVADSCACEQASNGSPTDIELLGNGGFAQSVASEVSDFLRLADDFGGAAVRSALFAGLSDTGFHPIAQNVALELGKHRQHAGERPPARRCRRLSSNGTENRHKLVHASSTPAVCGSRSGQSSPLATVSGSVKA